MRGCRGLSTADSTIKQVAERANAPEPIDVSVGFIVGGFAGEPEIYLLRVGTEERLLDEYPSITRYDAFFSEGNLSSAFPIPLTTGAALGATGAVLIVAAARRHKTLAPTAGMCEFAVTLRDERRFAAAIFRLSGKQSLF